MRYLLDTSVLIWWLGSSKRLRKEIYSLIDKHTICVSVASIWEMSIKKSLGKLKTPDDLLDQLESNGFKVLPITAKHAFEVGKLPLNHKDPFDRILLVQAMIEDMILITSDKIFKKYEEADVLII